MGQARLKVLMNIYYVLCKKFFLIVLVGSRNEFECDLLIRSTSIESNLTQFYKSNQVYYNNDSSSHMHAH